MEEKKNWKERLGSYDSWASNESMFITIDGETIYTIDELKSFIQQELDRAREEGRREQRELDCSLYGSACAEENFDEKWKLEFGMTEEKENI